MSADLDDVPVELRPAVAAALDAAGVTDGHLSLELVDTDRIHELNRDHRGKDEPTDVLSFPIDGTGPNAGPRELGDIVICAPVVQREARLQGKDVRAHFAHLTVHGVLHLLGFDHDDPREADLMENLEREILAGLGFDDPYTDEVG